MPKSLHQIKVEAAEKHCTDNLHTLLGISKEEFERRMNTPYQWPTNAHGERLPQGDCSACKQIDARHPEGTACDFSCVGVQ